MRADALRLSPFGSRRVPMLLQTEAAECGLACLAMVASFLGTIALAMWWTALPALPLLSAAFLAVNADLLVRGVRRGQGAPAQ